MIVLAAANRPTVSVIVPFAGRQTDLELVLGALAGLTLGVHDELIVADNRPGGPGAALCGEPVRICPVPGLRSAAFARNRAARVATAEWLVFVDADTRPVGSLLNDYFDPLPGPSTAVLAGGIVDVADSGSLAARHSASRGHMSQRTTLRRAGSPYAQTANCAVLHSAFDSVGGFAQEIRSGEDADLCFRLARAGWRIEERPNASVTHRSRETLGALLRQLTRHGSGAAWLNRQYPGEFPAPGPRQLAARLVHGVGGAGGGLARGQPEAAAFALLDLVTASAFDLGRLLPNRARSW